MRPSRLRHAARVYEATAVGANPLTTAVSRTPRGEPLRTGNQRVGPVRPTPMATNTTLRYATLAALGTLALAAAVTAGAVLTGDRASAFTPTVTTAAQPTGITVTGTGTVKGTPDTLRLDMGVEVTEPSVDVALDKANAVAQRVHDALRKAGVKAEDLQTTGLNISPTYDYPPAGGSPVLRGYTVNESVSATLRDIDKAGGAISAAVSAGGNDARVNGISLALEGTGSLLTDARTRAVEDAKAKAEAYAEAVGRDLGPLVSISEQVSTPSPIAYGRENMDTAAQSAVPIELGSQAVAVTVTAVYAFG